MSQGIYSEIPPGVYQKILQDNFSRNLCRDLLQKFRRETFYTVSDRAPGIPSVIPPGISPRIIREVFVGLFLQGFLYSEILQGAPAEMSSVIV